MSDVVVVLPTYDERPNIRRIVPAVLDRACHPDVLVVDDSSPDGTADEVRTLADEVPGRVHLLVRPRKQGLGRAYVAAFRHILASGRYGTVVQMDVDGSHDPADVDQLVTALADADLAIGSRYVPGGSVVGWTAHRRWLSRGGNVYARRLLSAGVRDLTGGFKAWRADLLARLDVDTVAADGYAFQIETTVRALRLGATVVEVPIVFRDREQGSSKMSTRIAVEALLRVPTMRGRRPGQARSSR